MTRTMRNLPRPGQRRRWFDMGGSYGQDDVFVIWTMAIIWTLLLTAGLLEWFFERRKK